MAYCARCGCTYPVHEGWCGNRERLEAYRALLERAADRLQEYASDVAGEFNAHYNDPLAWEIKQYLRDTE